MATTAPRKLKIKSLQYLSAVGNPAQGDGARALLLKSGDAGDIELTLRVTKTDSSLGLVFGHAFASSLDGGDNPHVDLQQDAIDPDFLEAAMDWIEGGGATDVNHDGDQDGRVIFAWPLVPEINSALGIESDTVGLAVAIKPSPETFARFASGELQGFSIAGTGERSDLDGPGTAAGATLTKTRNERLLQSSVESFAKRNSIRSFEQAFAKATLHDPASRDAYDAVVRERAASSRSRTAPAIKVDSDSIVKAAAVALSKAEADLKIEVIKFQRAHKIETYAEAFTKSTYSDPAVRAAYDTMANARHEMTSAPILVATRKLDDELTQLRAEIEKRTEAFSIQWNLESAVARERLTKISPTYAKMVDRALAVGSERQAVVERAKRAQQQ